VRYWAVCPPEGLQTIAWTDLTIPNAEPIAQFYKEVVGWNIATVDMGDYSDFNMLAPNGEPAAGICHARGSNMGIPPMWMIYVTVENIASALERVEALGGKVLRPLSGNSEIGFYAPIQDPAGACMMLFESPQISETEE
jgi:uncharacterized protein